MLAWSQGYDDLSDSEAIEIDWQDSSRHSPGEAQGHDERDSPEVMEGRAAGTLLSYL